MPKIFRALAVALIGCAAGPSLAGEQVGVAAAVQGDVSVRTDQKSRRAASGETMFLGDQVASRARSGMQILLLDETTFTVGADCDVTIDEFVYAPAGGNLSATVSKGALRYVSGLVAKQSPDAVKLKTPASTIGLRGTSADLVVGADAIRLGRALGLDTTAADPRTATLAVLRGPGSERTSVDNRGRARLTGTSGSVDLERAGYAGFIGSRAAPPQGPIRMTDEAERLLQGLIAGRAQARAGGGGSLNAGSGVNNSGQTWVEGRPFDLDHERNQRGTGGAMSGGGGCTGYAYLNYPSFAVSCNNSYTP